MAAPLKFKKRVRMREDAPVDAPARRLPRLVLPVASYWLFSGVVIYGIASGALPLRRWVQLLDEPDHESAELEMEAYASELPADHRAAPEPEAPTPVVAEPPSPELAVKTAALAFGAAAIDERPIGRASPAPSITPPPTEQVTSSEPPPRLAAREPALRSGPKRRLSVSGFSGATLTWRSERDPFLESLPAFEPPDEGSAVALPEPARERLPPLPEPGLDPADDEPKRAPRDDAAVARVAPASSCEAAIAAYNEQLDLKGPRRAADLPREAFAAVLDRGSYLASCGVPDTMRVDICAAVQRGRAVGVTVVTRPANGRIQSCVARAVRGLKFPFHPKLDVARTRFD